MKISENLKLREQYDSGLISSNDFIDRLFKSEEADRRRREIVEMNKKNKNTLLYSIIKMRNTIRRRMNKYV